MSAKGKRIRAEKQAQLAAQALQWSPEKKARVEARNAESARVNAVRAARIAGNAQPTVKTADPTTAPVDGPQLHTLPPMGPDVPDFVLAAREREEDLTTEEPEEEESPSILIVGVVLVVAIIAIFIIKRR